MARANAAAGGAAAPAFWQALNARYGDGVAHAFVLHGNVHDYAPGGGGWMRLESFLLARLTRFDLCAALDAAHGLRFPLPGHAELATRALGVSGMSPAAQILAAADPKAPPAARLLPVTRETIALATQLLDALLTYPWTVGEGSDAHAGRMAVVVRDAHLIVPDGDLRGQDAAILARFLGWGRAMEIGAAGHLLLAVTDSYGALHADLRRATSRWDAIAVPLPNEETRRQFVADLARQHARQHPGLRADPAAVARQTGALTLLGVEDIVLRALGAGGEVTADLVAERKEELVRQEYSDVLRIVDPRHTLDRVAGYDYLKAWLTRTVVAPWRADGRVRIGGLLLSGPPGTGKTLLAEAIAGEVGVPLVVFDLARILGQYVGQSERNLDRALDAVMALAPCVLFIDELDQVTGRGGGGDGGSRVDSRVFARLLTFLEDQARRGVVLAVAATNRPDLLDAALRSRFDRTAPVLPPTPADRAAILRQIVGALAPGVPLGAPALEEAVARTNGWTGRNLRDLGGLIGDLLAEGMPLDAAILAALDLYRPPLRDTAAQTALALAEISDLRLLPPEYRRQAHADDSGDRADAPPSAPPAEPRRRRGGDL